METSPVTDYFRAVNPLPTFRVVRESFSGQSKFRRPSQLTIFTDGSKMNDRVGTGYVLYEGTVEYDHGSYSLSPYSTVFQAELTAILLAARYVLREARSLRPRYVKILSDSRSALLALSSRRSSCRTTMDTLQALQTLASTCRSVRLVWVPSHFGIIGNARADSLAKEGTAVLATESPYTPLCPVSFSRSQVSRYFHGKWAAEWDSYNGGRMTKEFLPRPNPSQVGPLLDLDRTTLTLCLSFLTSHNNLRYQYSLREPDVSPDCRFCLLAPETSAHLYADCPRFSTLRFDINGLFHIPRLPPIWTVD